LASINLEVIIIECSNNTCLPTSPLTEVLDKHLKTVFPTRSNTWSIYLYPWT